MFVLEGQNCSCTISFDERTHMVWLDFIDAPFGSGSVGDAIRHRDPVACEEAAIFELNSNGITNIGTPASTLVVWPERRCRTCIIPQNDGVLDIPTLSVIFTEYQVDPHRWVAIGDAAEQPSILQARQMGWWIALMISVRNG